MIHFRYDQKSMLRHTADVMQDRISDEPDQWDDSDQDVVNGINAMGKSGTTSAVVLTGAELNPREADDLMRRILGAEVANWVPDASQRLIWRSMRALGYDANAAHLLTDQPDCGLEPHWHALIRTWLIGETYMRCVTCGRLYRD